MLCGIDPGSHGAIAWLDDDGSLLAVADLPIAEVMVGGTKRRRLVPILLASMLRERRPVSVFLEEVGTRPGEGAVGAFTLGRNMGQIEGVLGGLGLSYTLVRPQKWKRSLGLTEDKELCRERALRLWPAHAATFKRKMDADRAEASLIGLYGTGIVQDVAA